MHYECRPHLPHTTFTPARFTFGRTSLLQLVEKWAAGIVVAVAMEWFVIDVAIIIVRNNVKWTRYQIRSVRYQFMEKALKSCVGSVVGSMFVKILRALAFLLGV